MMGRRVGITEMQACKARGYEVAVRAEGHMSMQAAGAATGILQVMRAHHACYLLRSSPLAAMRPMLQPPAHAASTAPPPMHYP